MIRTDYRERDRLVVAVCCAILFHVTAYFLGGMVNWGESSRPKYEKMVLINLSDAVTDRPAEKAVPEKSVESAAEAPPAQAESPKQEAPKQEPPKPQPVVKPAAAVPGQTPPARTQPPVKNIAQQSVPVLPQDRIVADPSEAVPVKPVSSVGQKPASAQPEVKPETRQPDANIPDWARDTQNKPIAVGNTGTPASGITPAAPSQTTPGIDTSKLDAALASANAGTGTGTGSGGNSPRQQVGAPPVRSTSTVKDIDWTDPNYERAILHREDPNVKSITEREGLRVEVTARLTVLPDGTVGLVDIVKSSGYAEIDNIVRAAYRRWRFEPVRSTQNATGTIIFTTIPNVR